MAAYALIVTDCKNVDLATRFIFERGEDTNKPGRMMHPFVKYENRVGLQGRRFQICFICGNDRSLHFYGEESDLGSSSSDESSSDYEGSDSVTDLGNGGI